jgi:tRNA modification GTPase
MADDSSLGARLARQKALPLFTCTDPAIGIGVLEALHAGGMRVVEFTNRSAGALEVFRTLVAEAARRLPDLMLGAGTIIDLAQAEAVADLIDAHTEAAARSAARSLAGAFSDEIAGLAAQLVELRMLVEATLDFPEEEIDFLEKARARERLAGIHAALERCLQRTRQGALLREGLRVVLAGQPNVGKSSLLNALAGAELAIVTPIPGTTRDRVAETLQIQGVPLVVTDTAGLRLPHEAADEVERIGIARSWEAIAGADVVLFLRDLSRRGEAAYDAADAEIATLLPAATPRIEVWNKRDAVVVAEADPDAGPEADAEAEADQAAPAALPGPPALLLSARHGQGLDGLRQRLLECAGWQAAPEGLYIARTRHVQALQHTLVHLQAAEAHAAQRDAALDLLAEELRLAHRALAAITGEFGVEDLLGEIFGRFCIGK